MDKLEILDRGIAELRRIINEGWRDIAAGDLTAFQRGELRERMTRAAADLRHCLLARETETRRLASARNSGSVPRSVTLRFLNTDYDLGVAAVPSPSRPMKLEPEPVS